MSSNGRAGLPSSPWPVIVLLYASGLLAAAQLGKLSALAPSMATELGLSLPVIAVAISLIELGGATGGALSSVVAHRVGLPRTLRWATALLACGGLGGAWAHGPAGLFGWRLLEAAGYLGVIVSAPVLIVRHAAAGGPRLQGLALTLWSTFVPVGLALGAWAYAGLAGAWGWRAAVGIGGALALAAWSALCRTPLPPDPQGPADAARGLPPMTPALWCLALGFGGFALFEVGVLGLLPTLLVREAGLAPARAGLWTAVASASAIGGSGFAGWLVRNDIGVRWPIVVSVGLPPVLLFGVFMAAPPQAQAIGLVVAVNLLGGIFASLGFALLPRLADSPGRLVRANGILAQCGATGSLLGPPTMAACVEFGGWPAAACWGLAVSLAVLPLAWAAARASAAPAAGTHGAGRR